MSSQPPFPAHGPALLSVGGAVAAGEVVAPLSPTVSLGAHPNPRGSSQGPGLGQVEHIHYLSEHIGALFLDDEYSDVTFVVRGQRFEAHRVILAARSEYFRALLFGGMIESKLKEIELKDTSLPAFRFLLRYIYTGQMNLGNLKDDLIVDILGLAHQYGFQDLETAISDYLKAILNIHNVCFIYDTASLYQLDQLKSSCCLYMDRHAQEIIKHDAFNTLTASGIRDVISRDSFCAPEVEIFQAVHKWVQANPAEDSSQILAAVRLSLMSTSDLLKVVRPSNLVPPDAMLDAIESRSDSRDMELKYRGYLIPEENVAQPRHDSQVLIGEVKQALLDGDTKNYDMERGFSRHPIDDIQDKGIVVRLGMQCIINHVRMLLWDRDSRAYSYFIEVSMDQEDWIRVVDHSKFLCRSWQDLYFAPRVVRYIRIVGTHNTVNKVFHLVSFECYYTKKPFQLDEQGIVIPRQNVATIPKSACVIEGVCRTRNALLNGETSQYDWDSGYTCHQLGSGSIVVQLGQPYALSSMKLLLWDCDNRSYSYYIEVSINQRDWEVVCDRSRVNCKSWQTISFPRRPVVFIKIVGTHNTANEVFHCVHFECFEDDQSAIEADKTQGKALVSASASPSRSNSASGSSSSNGSSPRNPRGATGVVNEDDASSSNRANSGQWPPGYDQAARLTSPDLPGQVPQMAGASQNRRGPNSTSGAVARPLARPANAMDHFYLPPQAEVEGQNENRERAAQGLGAVSRQRPTPKDMDPLV